MFKETDDDYKVQVLNFVKNCLDKNRIVFWKAITKAEEKALADFSNPEVLKVFFEPEKYPKLIEKYVNDFSKLEFIENNKECAFDAFLYNRFKNLTRFNSTHDIKSLIQFFKEKEEAFFTSSEAVPEPGLKQLKSVKNYTTKILNLLKTENQVVFFDFKANAFGCYFYTPFLENIFFPVEKMNLIPAFVRWRNKNFIRWIIEAVKTSEERALKEFEKQLLLQELGDADRELNRSYYEKYEDKIISLFEMKTNFKLNLVQQTVDLSSDIFIDVKKIILIRYTDFRSILKPEIEFSLSVDNFENDFSNLKTMLN